MKKEFKDALRRRLDDATRVATEDACKGMEDETQMKLRADVAKEQYEEDSRQGLVGARP
ncbi:hypothetical protein [Streptomyces echinatus]|uniref:Uncharacterized protein n=1 Tax=Streptomyces echinatus TaxID=67293 RepID=A0A7W9PRR6_9ACTN|nr:hypothetical protein [Streptomyces echinatus]MBB5926660.1 hypothetical protein [Streptomyces echinatus]